MPAGDLGDTPQHVRHPPTGTALGRLCYVEDLLMARNKPLGDSGRKDALRNRTRLRTRLW
jgi:hypothetical protein